MVGGSSSLYFWCFYIETSKDISKVRDGALEKPKTSQRPKSKMRIAKSNHRTYLKLYKKGGNYIKTAQNHQDLILEIG